ncbi:uncharacterized protein LOC141933686 [Strix aluco]|uniref:uncharacterized protein LOC141933686 n=1 Tax=Strix aluco TaxID=111821 RepID=UPI003DA59046
MTSYPSRSRTSPLLFLPANIVPHLPSDTKLLSQEREPWRLLVAPVGTRPFPPLRPSSLLAPDSCPVILTLMHCRHSSGRFLRAGFPTSTSKAQHRQCWAEALNYTAKLQGPFATAPCAHPEGIGPPQSVSQCGLPVPFGQASSPRGEGSTGANPELLHPHFASSHACHVPLPEESPVCSMLWTRLCQFAALARHPGSFCPLLHCPRQQRPRHLPAYQTARPTVICATVTLTHDGGPEPSPRSFAVREYFGAVVWEQPLLSCS